MASKKKSKNSGTTKKYWCVLKVLKSGYIRTCCSTDMYQVSSDNRYWPFLPLNPEDYEPNTEYGCITEGKTLRMIMHHILFMSSKWSVKRACCINVSGPCLLLSSDHILLSHLSKLGVKEEVDQAFESRCLPNGSRLPNPKRRQTLTPTEFSLNKLSLMNVKTAARDEKVGILVTPFVFDGRSLPFPRRTEHHKVSSFWLRWDKNYVKIGSNRCQYDLT